MRRFLRSGARSRVMGIAAAVALAAVSGCADRKEDIGTFITTPQVDDAHIIKVGILHSLSGRASRSEIGPENTEMMAIVDINRNGGVLGKQIEPVIEDGAGNPATFAAKAQKLLEQDKVAAIFGCWSSESRKAVEPVLEKDKGLLFYPAPDEGMESSPNIFYIGSDPSQQAVPAVNYLLKQGRKNILLLGSETGYSHTVNSIVRAQLGAEGGTVAGEEYMPPFVVMRSVQQRNQYMGSVDALIARVKAAKPDAVFSSLSGYDNLFFFRELKTAGITAAQLPILSVGLTESAVPQSMAADFAGVLCAANYFETTRTPENDRFVKAYKDDYGDDRVTDDPMEAGYLSVYLWKAMVEKAKSASPADVVKAADGVTFAAPEGEVRVDGKNHHLWKTARIGRLRPDGQIDEVWSSGTPLEPDPYLQKFSWARGLTPDRPPLLVGKG